MFIDKLTDEQISTYLKKTYPKYHFSFQKCGSQIYVTVTNPHSLPDDYTWHEVYYDFDASHDSSRWIKYLAKLFGDEYKDAYARNSMKIFE